MKRVGVIGCGRIGAPVIRAIQAGQAGEWSLLTVLTQSERQLENIISVTDADVFFGHDLDLVIDTAAPISMKKYGVRALSVADLWTVNAAALADPALYEQLEQAGKHHQHRLRILSGAIAGLDGVGAISIDEDAQISTTVDLAPGEDSRTSLFKGSVREAALLYPDSVNVAVATALAGPGLDKVEIEVMQPGPGEARKLCIKAVSEYGQFEVESIPRVVPGQHIHTVAACIIAALRRESKVIWVG